MFACNMFAISCNSNDALKLGIIGKHSFIYIQFAAKSVDVNYEHIRTEDGALRNNALNRDVCRLLVTDMDSLGATA
ncbi:unnamed protein product [Dibothriocephalus latus]|uniref:Uncharacterized protein n=1 Tax=Dibothriocephalus latus TaxID=60516 RepID=A0A3P6STN6_DIBLA|nr:unnamed protein product [Dibothriocephalus latus]